METDGLFIIDHRVQFGLYLKMEKR